MSKADTRIIKLFLLMLLAQTAKDENAIKFWVTAVLVYLIYIIISIMIWLDNLPKDDD